MNEQTNRQQSSYSSYVSIVTCRHRVEIQVDGRSPLLGWEKFRSQGKRGACSHANCSLWHSRSPTHVYQTIKWRKALCLHLIYLYKHHHPDPGQVWSVAEAQYHCVLFKEKKGRFWNPGSWRSLADLVWDQRFSSRDDFCTPEDISKDIFGCHNLQGEALVASGG